MGHINKQCTSKSIQPLPSSIIKLGPLARKECGAFLFKTNDKTHISLQKPICTFTYQSLNKWLTSHMWIPGFEKLLNAHKTHNSQTDPKVISDIWYGKIWHQFKSSPRSKQAFTYRPGNFVFSLYVDWLNLSSNKGAAQSISIGSIILTCLTLPPSEGYKEENMFLYAIITGPKEPSLDQMSSILELQILCNGIWFSNTHDFPQGRLIRVALLPLIADFPALRKVAAFASHLANKFCSFCNITKVEINEIDTSKFQPRTHETHLSKANECSQVQTKKEQDDFVKSNGVHWSILNNLDYWRPIDFCGIHIIHFLILGNMKEYCISFLKVGLAGHELALKEKEKFFWQTPIHPNILLLHWGLHKKGKMMMKMIFNKFIGLRNKTSQKPTFPAFGLVLPNGTNALVKLPGPTVIRLKKATEPKVVEQPPPGIPLDPKQPLLPF
ncbi:hypothetical protein O181_085765 [Austropuccinia psidii MF-1]|uniref:Uncharacterized protein n=1 Tax=Austropuccinia psidii MF-1 TaxID=1389203 RepID=A0A9Q3FY60_9BASI|nr:hypothetical protein [Austropuccinia psidii MF-1]